MAGLDLVVVGNAVRGSVSLTLPDRLSRAGRAQDLQGLLDRGQIVRGDQDGRRVAMTGDRDTFVRAPDLRYQLREPITRLADGPAVIQSLSQDQVQRRRSA